MRYILNGLKEDPELAPFRSAYKIFKKVKEPEETHELEDWMLDEERGRRVKKEQHDATRWTFPSDRRNRNSNTRYRETANTGSDEDDRSHLAQRAPNISRYSEQ